MDTNYLYGFKNILFYHCGLQLSASILLIREEGGGEMFPLAPPEIKRKVLFAVASISAQETLSEFANYLVKV